MTNSFYSPDEITSIAVVGFGTMGIGIAQIFAEAGFTVNVIDQTESTIEKGLTQVKHNISQCADAGLIAKPEQVLSRINGFSEDQFDQATQGIQLAVETATG